MEEHLLRIHVFRGQRLHLALIPLPQTLLGHLATAGGSHGQYLIQRRNHVATPADHDTRARTQYMVADEGCVVPTEPLDLRTPNAHLFYTNTRNPDALATGRPHDLGHGRLGLLVIGRHLEGHRVGRITRLATAQTHWHSIRAHYETVNRIGPGILPLHKELLQPLLRELGTAHLGEPRHLIPLGTQPGHLLGAPHAGRLQNLVGHEAHVPKFLGRFGLLVHTPMEPAIDKCPADRTLRRGGLPQNQLAPHNDVGATLPGHHNTPAECATHIDPFYTISTQIQFC